MDIHQQIITTLYPGRLTAASPKNHHLPANLHDFLDSSRYTPENSHNIGKNPHLQLANTSSNGGSSMVMVMLVFLRFSHTLFGYLVVYVHPRL